MSRQTSSLVALVEQTCHPGTRVDGQLGELIGDGLFAGFLCGVRRLYFS